MKKKKRKAQRRNHDSYERRELNQYSFDSFPLGDGEPFLRVRQGGQNHTEKPTDKYTKNEVRRRQNKKRKIKNKARNVLITLIAITAFLAIGVTLSLTIFFNITDINVTGSNIYSAEEIVQVSTIDVGENLFLIDTKECIVKLTESLPYIYEVKITRKLPSTLNIEVTDATPFLAIEKEDKTFILTDDRLKVLESSAAEKPADAITMTDTAVATANPGYLLGFEEEEIDECIRSIVAAIKATEMSEATAISCVDKNNNFIVYDNRITFKLGSCNNLEAKINRGLAVCDELNKHNDSIKGTVNLSVDKQSYFTEE